MLAALARGGAAVAITGGLIFAPFAVQAAEADAAIDLSLVTSALGGVLLASPGVVAGAATAEAGAVAATATACAATVVCGGVMVGLGVAALAFTHRDTWVPWISAVWAEVTGGDSFAAGNQFTMEFVTPPTGAGMTVHWVGTADGYWTQWLTGQTADVYMSVADGNGWMTCNGVQTFIVGQALSIVSGSSFWQGEGFPGSFDRTFTCPAGQTMTGGVIKSATSNDAGVAVIKWGDQGAPAGPATAMTTTNKVCQRPDGSTYTDSRSVSGSTSSIPVGFCLPGDKAISLGVVVTPTTGAPVVTQALPLTPTLTDVQDYPLCASAGCEYQIVLDGVPCRVGVAGCSEWFATSQATPSRVTGRYGPYAFPVSGLTFLRYVYGSKDGVKVTTTTATGGDPEQPQPKPIVPVAPPLLTDPIPTPTDPLPKPPTKPQTTADCFGQTISWNPVDWVMKPVQCALSWAFVPSAGFLVDWGDGIGSEFNNSPFGKWVNTVGAMGFTIPAYTGCQGPALPTGFLGEGRSFGSPDAVAVLPAELHPFDACSPPMSTVAATSNMILSAGIAFYGGMKVVRQLGAAFGFQVHIGSERETFT